MKLLIIILALFSFSTFAQWRHDNYFRFPTETRDGQIPTASIARLSPGVKWVWVHVEGNGKKDENYFPVSEGENFNQSIILRYGPGTYKYQIMTSKSDNKYGQYAVEHQSTVTNYLPEALDDIAPSCDIQSGAEEIISLAEKITANLQTDLEKTKAIHDWVAGNIAYDVDSYFQGTYTQKQWDALSVLKSGLGICQGYANLTAALNRAAGIKAKVVIGQADVFGSGWADHAWNEVYVDGRWIAQDTTWDAGNVDFQRKKFNFNLRHKYFDPKPEDFAVDHRLLNR